MGKLTDAEIEARLKEASQTLDGFQYPLAAAAEQKEMWEHMMPIVDELLRTITQTPVSRVFYYAGETLYPRCRRSPIFHGSRAVFFNMLLPEFAVDLLRASENPAEGMRCIYGKYMLRVFGRLDADYAELYQSFLKPEQESCRFDAESKYMQMISLAFSGFHEWTHLTGKAERENLLGNALALLKSSEILNESSVNDLVETACDYVAYTFMFGSLCSAIFPVDTRYITRRQALVLPLYTLMAPAFFDAILYTMQSKEKLNWLEDILTHRIKNLLIALKISSNTKGFIMDIPAEDMKYMMEDFSRITALLQELAGICEELAEKIEGKQYRSYALGTEVPERLRLSEEEIWLNYKSL